LKVIPGKLAIASATQNPGCRTLRPAAFHRHDGKTPGDCSNYVSPSTL